MFILAKYLILYFHDVFFSKEYQMVWKQSLSFVFESSYVVVNKGK